MEILKEDSFLLSEIKLSELSHVQEQAPPGGVERGLGGVRGGKGGGEGRVSKDLPVYNEPCPFESPQTAEMNAPSFDIQTSWNIRAPALASGCAVQVAP